MFKPTCFTSVCYTPTCWKLVCNTLICCTHTCCISVCYSRGCCTPCVVSIVCYTPLVYTHLLYKRIHRSVLSLVHTNRFVCGNIVCKHVSAYKSLVSHLYVEMFSDCLQTVFIQYGHSSHTSIVFLETKYNVFCFPTKWKTRIQICCFKFASVDVSVGES